MNDDSILGNALGQLGGVIKQTAKQVARTPQDIVEGVGDQPPAQDNKVAQSESSDKNTREVVKGLYAESSDNAQRDNLDKTKEHGFKNQIANKSEEEQKKLEIRQKLFEERHKETYYDPTFNPPKKTEEQEERPVEKVEREKKQEMQELEKKDAKKPPPLVQRARERVERFPGVSG